MLKHKKSLHYTFKHKLAYLKVEKELTGHISIRGLFHDLDKLFYYIFSSKEKEEIHKIHRMNQRHHDNDLLKTETDYLEMIIDWECARITKPDKPLNAYDTLYKYYPHLESHILPLLYKYNLVKNKSEVS